MATYSNVVTGGSVVDISLSSFTGTQAVTSLTTSANEFKRVYLSMESTSVAVSASLSLQITNGTTIQIASVSASAAGVNSVIGAIGGGSSNNRIDGGLLIFEIPPNTTVSLLATGSQNVRLRGTYITYAI